MHVENPHMEMYHEQHDLSDNERTGMKPVWAVICSTGVHILPHGQRAIQAQRKALETRAQRRLTRG